MRSWREPWLRQRFNALTAQVGGLQRQLEALTAAVQRRDERFEELIEAFHAFARRTGIPGQLVEIPRCIAHGQEACKPCAQNPSTCADGASDRPGCTMYAATGMHWDTCPNRIRTALPPQ